MNGPHQHMPEIHLHFHDAPDEQSFNRILGAISQLQATTKGLIMSAVDQLKAALKQNTDDLRGIAQQYLDFIKTKDALIVEKDAKIAALVNDLASGALTIADFQGAFEAAISDTQKTEDDLRAGLPGVPPVGGTPLALSFADRAAFDAGVAAYTGPESVSLDGQPTPKGGSPDLTYFTHSVDGHIDTTGPTD